MTICVQFFGAKTEAKGATGYLDLGWNRTTRAPTDAQLIDARGKHHLHANHTLKVPVEHEQQVISVADLRHYLGLPAGRRGGFGKGSAEHARARCISGCLRHSGSLIPEPGEFVGLRNGFLCSMDSGGRCILDEFVILVNRYMYL